MKTRIPASLLALAVGTASATPAPKGMDALAQDYLRLTLAMGTHDPAYVDAYYGPKELRDEAGMASPFW